MRSKYAAKNRLQGANRLRRLAYVTESEELRASEKFYFSCVFDTFFTIGLPRRFYIDVADDLRADKRRVCGTAGCLIGNAPAAHAEWKYSPSFDPFLLDLGEYSDWKNGAMEYYCLTLGEVRALFVPNRQELVTPPLPNLRGDCSAEAACRNLRTFATRMEKEYRDSHA